MLLSFILGELYHALVNPQVDNTSPGELHCTNTTVQQNCAMNQNGSSKLI